MHKRLRSRPHPQANEKSKEPKDGPVDPDDGTATHGRTELSHIQHGPKYWRH